MAANTNPSYYQRSSVSLQLQQTEHVFKLYMYQDFRGGSEQNQIIPLNTSQPHSFGQYAVANWAIRDARSATAKIVARAQGPISSVDQSTFRLFVCHNILFTDERFKGSSLMLIGTYIDADDGQWAVVGGSGEFLYAQGAINYKVLEHGKGLILRELDIRVLCPNTTIIPIPPNPANKDVPAMGGNGGDEFDIPDQAPPKRLESVIIRSGDVIDSIAFSYTDQAGMRQTAGPWGGNGGLPTTIVFAPAEVVTKVYGTTASFGGNVVVTSLTIATNITTYETLGKGKSNGTPFILPRKEGENVLGFFGRAGLFVDALGVYAA